MDGIIIAPPPHERETALAKGLKAKKFTDIS
jgi:hypothetical protein